MRSLIEAKERFSMNIESSAIIKHLDIDKIILYQLDWTGWPSKFAWIEFKSPLSSKTIKLLCEFEEQIDLKNVKAKIKYFFPKYRDDILNYIKSCTSNEHTS